MENVSLTLNDAKKVSTSTSTSTSLPVVVSSLSAPIQGKFGAFRVFTIGTDKFNVDNTKVSGAEMFSPDCKAVVTLNKYLNKEGVEKVIISSLAIAIPQASGFFIMK